MRKSINIIYPIFYFSQERQALKQNKTRKQVEHIAKYLTSPNVKQP